jgi:hypothetical protein
LNLPSPLPLAPPASLPAFLTFGLVFPFIPEPTLSSLTQAFPGFSAFAAALRTAGIPAGSFAFDFRAQPFSTKIAKCPPSAPAVDSPTGKRSTQFTS